jgi:DNA-binding response OmpR family regulator
MLDEKTKRAYKSGALLNLTDTEYDILSFFIENKIKICYTFKKHYWR